MSMEGKVCIVTGASSGIGEAIAVLFAERGARVALCGRSEGRLEKALKRCQEISITGGTGAGSAATTPTTPTTTRDRFITIAGDLTEQETRANIIKTTVATFGRVDVLIPNAGVIAPPKRIDDVTEEMYDALMETNVRAVFFLVKEAVPWLEKSKGNLVCISSVLAHTVAINTTIYCMSKASLDHMCSCLATELGPRGIRVNTVNPTFVRTRIMRTLIPSLAESEDLSCMDQFLNMKAALHPLEKRLPTVEEVAKATAFFASDEASFVTGEHLNIDGGVSRMCTAFQ